MPNRWVRQEQKVAELKAELALLPAPLGLPEVNIQVVADRGGLTKVIIRSRIGEADRREQGGLD